LIEHLSLATTYEIDESFDSEKFIKMRLRVCHDGENPNGSHFELEDMERARDSLANIPILAHVVFDEDGNPQFGGHDMKLEKNKAKQDENDDDYRLIYEEIPIGLVPESNNYAVEEYEGKNYVCCDCYGWKSYMNYAEDILERDEENKISMEILIDKYSYDVKEKHLNIIDYRYQGITFLNQDSGTGMIDARATTGTFEQDKILMMMDELKKVLSEGGKEVDELKELLEKYGLKESDIDFDVNDMKIEDIEAKLIEMSKNDDTTTDDVVDDVHDNTTDDTDEKPKLYLKTFEIPYEDIRYALYGLLEVVEEEDGEWYWIDRTFDDNFEYSNWGCTRIYRQGYKVEDETVKFAGDRIRLFQERLTQAEKDALDAMRESYAVLEEENKTLKKFKEDTLTEERKLAEEELFSQFDEKLKDNEEYAELRKNASEFTIEQLEKEVAFIMVKNGTGFKFSANKPSKKSVVRVEIPVKKEEHRGEYDDLFEKYGKGGE